RAGAKSGSRDRQEGLPDDALLHDRLELVVYEVDAVELAAREALDEIRRDAPRVLERHVPEKVDQDAAHGVVAATEPVAGLASDDVHVDLVLWPWPGRGPRPSQQFVQEGTRPVDDVGVERAAQPLVGRD